jgi:hypothetical protein
MTTLSCATTRKQPAGLIDLQNSMLEVDGRRVSLKYAGKLGCFRVVAHDKVVMTDLSLACYSDKTFDR